MCHKLCLSEAMPREMILAGDKLLTWCVGPVDRLGCRVGISRLGALLGVIFYLTLISMMFLMLLQPFGYYLDNQYNLSKGWCGEFTRYHFVLVKQNIPMQYSYQINSSMVHSYMFCRMFVSLYATVPCYLRVIRAWGQGRSISRFNSLKMLPATSRRLTLPCELTNIPSNAAWIPTMNQDKTQIYRSTCWNEMLPTTIEFCCFIPSPQKYWIWGNACLCL